KRGSDESAGKRILIATTRDVARSFAAQTNAIPPNAIGMRSSYAPIAWPGDTPPRDGGQASPRGSRCVVPPMNRRLSQSGSNAARNVVVAENRSSNVHRMRKEASSGVVIPSEGATVCVLDRDPMQGERPMKKLSITALAVVAFTFFALFFTSHARAE